MANHFATNALRIAHIEEMMREFRWQRGKSDKVLAAEWGLAPNTVRELAAEASRNVAAQVMDRDGVRVDVGIALQKALAGSLGDGDWKAVAQIAKVFADTSGATAPAKSEVEVTTPAATPTEAARLIREAFGERAAKKPEPAEPDAVPVDVPGSPSAG